VLFDGAQRWLAYSERPDRIVDWVQHLSTRPVDEPSLRELVDIVTADDHVARSVNGVRIIYPAPLLQGGVVIVDTPGLNAEQTHHAEAVALEWTDGRLAQRNGQGTTSASSNR
jgi:hypothetical protein